MPRYIAFLRAINVGGHIVKMDRLRQLFEWLGCSHVETFIASGNVVFETPVKNADALARRVETELHKALGYEIPAFVRTLAEVAEIAEYKPFTDAEMKTATALNIAFLAEPLDAKAKRQVLALKTDIDTFHVHGRQVYWLCRKKQSESTFSNAVLEKTLGKPSTIRGANTVKKIAEKYAR